jgi:putative Holliday junction resolvase
MFDILGVDWGEKRFGLAFADSSSQLIVVADYECPSDKIWDILDSEIQNRGVKTVVVGRPTNFQGQNTLITDLVDNFIHQFKTNYPYLQVDFVNERNSTRYFQEKATDKQQLNHLAAGRILEFYFGLEQNS